MGRIEKSSKNIKYTVIAYGVNYFFKFLVRFIFVKLLPIEYLGINGLFTNLLGILSLAELGIGPAIVYSLYQPLATKDVATIKSLMLLFKRHISLLVSLLLLLGFAYCHGWIGL
ncbi:MAG: hypothetical protein EP149_02850 [Phascolarctobacterium sp.]|nr:hypothetical protein [Phascolarctobacterium sp.]MUU06687.1 hypothetical protein [Phascolarctobacterium sp.]MUU16329.1 hypothetical protein [Phascolarctobacterium sp.]